MNFKIIDIFSRRKDIWLEEEIGGLFLHASGRLYRRLGGELRLVGTYNHLEEGKWVRRSYPMLFYAPGAMLGTIQGG